MIRSFWILALGSAFAAALGCGGTTGKAKAIPVKGVVTLDGKPLAGGEVSFVLTGQAPTIIPVKDGAFAGEAFAGSNKVEVRSYKSGPPLSTDPDKAPTKMNFIPDRFNATTTLTAEVAAGGANDFKFAVTSK